MPGLDPTSHRRSGPPAGDPRRNYLAGVVDERVAVFGVRTPIEHLTGHMAGDSKFSDLSGRISVPDKKAALETEVAKQLQFRGKRRAILANWRGDSFINPTTDYVEVKTQGIPALLTWGTEDKMLPEDSMKRLRDLIPDIEYHEIDGASHLAHYEYPERVNPILIEFLTRPEADEVPIRAVG